jgi:epoxyqueuosine reductase
MSSAERTRSVCARARELGFDLCGVAPVEARQNLARAGAQNDALEQPFQELSHVPEWLARGYAGEMNYLRDPRRSDPRLVLEGARSLIVVALNYNSPLPASTHAPAQARDGSPRGWISRYAWGDDYHEVIHRKLEALVRDLRAEFHERFEARAYVDTGPIIERVAAKYAGLGWLAKNTCLINQQLGSWLFLGVIVTTLALEPTLAPGEPPPHDLCGSCTRCIEACPTQAFPEPYVLDSRRCISYLTIELRGAIPEQLRPSMGRAVVGCDICQDVCPWNRKTPLTKLAAFQPRQGKQAGGLPGEENRSLTNESRNAEDARGELRISNDEFQFSLFAPELEWLASLSQQEYSRVFGRSAVKRAKWRGLVRNACVALGNSGITRDSPSYPRVVRLLERLASAEDSLIAEHAGWALKGIDAGRANRRPRRRPDPRNGHAAPQRAAEDGDGLRK